MKEIAQHVSKCMTFKQVKAKHQRPAGTLQNLEVSEGKWYHIMMDFVVRIPRT